MESKELYLVDYKKMVINFKIEQIRRQKEVWSLSLGKTNDFKRFFYKKVFMSEDFGLTKVTIAFITVVFKRRREKNMKPLVYAYIYKRATRIFMG